MSLNLHQYLALPGHSQAKLAVASGLNAATICRVLSGKSGCSLQVALKLDAATDGAIRAEKMCTPGDAALLARLRGTAGAKPARAASADFDLPAPNDVIKPS